MSRIILLNFCGGFVLSLVLSVVMSSVITSSDERIIKNRNNLIDIYEDINLNDYDGIVAKKIITGALRASAHAKVDKNSATWYVSTNGDINYYWILILCFRSEYLVGLRFGEVDNMSMSPPDSPPAKGMCVYG